MNNSAAAKKILVSIIVSILAFSILSWFPNPDSKDIVRFAVNCIFCWYLYKGKNWARWILVFLLGLAGSYGVLMSLNGNISLEKGVLLYAMSFTYIVSAILLIFSKVVSRYFSGHPSENS
jgi:hypothetical protein